MGSSSSSERRLGAKAIRAQLQRILASAVFANAPILSRFLRHVVECRLSGTRTPPKEYAIGVEVFGRGAAFDPRTDTIVRVQARRLRVRLERYYSTDGVADPIRISVPKGHYLAEAIALAEPATPQSHPFAPVEGSVAPLTARSHFRRQWLPAPRTPLIGRQRELRELHALLTAGEPRLVTLVGPTGSGKTRLATEFGHQLQGRHADSVVFVPLANVFDASTLQLALLRALGLHATDNTPPIEIACRHLRQRVHAPLLLLDTFEQLLPAAPLIGSLLEACPSLKILATSQAPLHVYGEHVYPVVPLTLPTEGALSLKSLGTVPAVALFVQRAVAANPDFRLTVDNAEAVVGICRQLDGLPLGIELAAAQCRVMSPSQLLRRFPGQLDWPADPAMGVAARRRSLRSAIKRSYDRLGPREGRLFRRLAVFSGDFSLEAAVAVADCRRNLGLDMVEGITRLLDGSLLQLAPHPDELRYSMLETIHAYARERLATSGEYNDIRRAHAAWCLTLAETGNAPPDAAGRDAWRDRCDLERDNLHAAIEWLVESGNGAWALRLIMALFTYWWQRKYLAQARLFHRAVLERFPPDTDLAAWARAALHAGMLEDRAGEHAAARARYLQVADVAHKAGDAQLEAKAVAALGAPARGSR